jgi:ATP-dependent DNA helicase PIF1
MRDGLLTASFAFTYNQGSDIIQMGEIFSVCRYVTVTIMTQQEAFTVLKTGANIFLTGEPGSGKTHTINTYVAYLRERGIEPAITASTGIAATHIGGYTIHSWSGIGIRTQMTDYDLDRLSQNERLVRKIQRAQVLIIDEVSMLSATTLGMIEAVCRALRRNEHSFGGLQVVLVGDFFQLPPVVRRSSEEEVVRLDFEDAHEESIFAYGSRAWRGLNPVICYLDEQHRQEDAVFLELLSAVRSGSPTSKHRAALQARRVPVGAAPSGITQLFSHNVDVDRINEKQLQSIPGTARAFEMGSSGATPLIDQLKKSCLSPERLMLKVGAKVMFTKNDPEHAFVNGTTGEIVGFASFTGHPRVVLRDGREVEAEPMEWVIEAEGRPLAKIEQVPLRLAWAITVHKSQGMSLDAAVVDLSQAFEYGQGYVALSRVRTLQGLHLLGLNERALEVHPEVLEQDSDFRRQSEEAQEIFATISPIELATLQNNFIKACGGNEQRKNAPEYVGS